MTASQFESIFEAHQDAVYGFAWRMTGSAEAAEDIAQDCFVHVLKGTAMYNSSRGAMRSWLLGIARNLVLKRWRSENRWQPLDEDIVEAPDLPDFDIQEQVAQAIQALPLLQREALILAEYEGFTLEETANAVDAEVGTVKARLHRARTNLRRVLEPMRNVVHDR